MQAARDEPLAEFVMTALAASCNCDRAAISPATNVMDLGLDSIGLMAFAASVEATLSFSLSEPRMLDLLESIEVGDIVAVIQAAVSSERLSPPPAR